MSKGKKISSKSSTDLQNFRICFRKFRASLPLPFGFRCNSFHSRCCDCDCKGGKCLLTLCIVKFAFPP